MVRAQEVIVEVQGMTSDECERRVVEALAAVRGVASARASRPEGQASVTADPTTATPEILRRAIEEAGYISGEVRFPE